MAQDHLTSQPGITADNDGPKVVIVGGIMLSTTVLMICIATYNRYTARTMHHADSPLLLAGAAMDIGCFALMCVAVKHGFGQRAHLLDESTLRYLKQLFLGSILVFFLSHGIIKISYNLLARHTARGKRFRLAMDALSGFIMLWTFSNITVVAISLHKESSPKRVFFWISGALSIVIVLGQLFAFLWLIWGTKAQLKVKIRWSISMGAFVPLCIIAIILRLVYTPADYFAGDWTFSDVVQGMLFQIELNLVTITVLAPNLPVFFQKTSTGGVFFLPGEATKSANRNSQLSKEQSNELKRLRWSEVGRAGVFDGMTEETITSTATRSGVTEPKRKKSFDSSEFILMQRSFEVNRDDGVGTAGQESPSRVHF